MLFRNLYTLNIRQEYEIWTYIKLAISLIFIYERYDMISSEALRDQIKLINQSDKELIYGDVKYYNCKMVEMIKVLLDIKD